MPRASPHSQERGAPCASVGCSCRGRDRSPARALRFRSPPTGRKPANAYAVTVLAPDPQPITISERVGPDPLGTSPGGSPTTARTRSTVYRADGSKLPIRVGIPGGARRAPSSTAIETTSTGDNFLFDGESGNDLRLARRLRVDRQRRGRQRRLRAADAVFKGLAIGTADVGDGAQQYLYATDFHNGRIDVFDRTFTAQTWTGAFHDPELPAGFAPFGIQTLNGTGLP